MRKMSLPAWLLPALVSGLTYLTRYQEPSSAVRTTFSTPKREKRGKLPVEGLADN